MRRLGFALPLVFCVLLTPLTVSARSASAVSEAIQLVSIHIKLTPEGASVEILADRPFAFVTYTLKEPDRLVVDLVDSAVESSLPETTPVGDDLIHAWHISRSVGADPSSNVDTVTFDLAEPSEHLVESNTHVLVIRLRPKGRATPVNFALDLFPENPAGSSAVRSAGAGEPWDLDTALGFGLDRHKPVQVAREEIQLAEMKLREAQRALFPAATVKTSWTEGTASKVNFTEVSSGLQMEQPLYASGRLIATFRQALVNLKVAEKRQGKVKSDFALEIAQAYFQFIGAKATLAAHEEMVAETRNFLARTQDRFDQGLLTRLELLNVQAQVHQSEFQEATSKNDLALSELKFLQRLNLEAGEKVEVPSEFLPVASAEMGLEEAIQLALLYRPDILLNNLLVEFNEFEERIAKAKAGTRIDLSGFLGASGAAFETETLSLDKDYFVGVKVTQPWGPHGAVLSATTTKTAPRLGQTTRTDSAVFSGEMGILNQLQGLSEIQQAHVGLEKARAELEQTKQAVIQEVQEACISYSKARIQLEYAKQKIDFRQEQVKVLQAQAGINEALPSQVLEAIMKLNDEQVGEVQALTNYYVAVAKLNKAIGLTSHYR